LEGELSGQYVTGAQAVTLSIDGAPLDACSTAGSYYYFDVYAPTVSFNTDNNNFYFLAANGDWFAMNPANAPSYGYLPGGPSPGYSFGSAGYGFPTLPGNWSLVEVPGPGPYISGAFIQGTNFILTGTNGTANVTYYVLCATNLTLALADWTRVSTTRLPEAVSTSRTLCSPTCGRCSIVCSFSDCGRWSSGRHRRSLG
jgi:hypothetical protein